MSTSRKMEPHGPPAFARLPCPPAPRFSLAYFSRASTSFIRNGLDRNMSAPFWSATSSPDARVTKVALDTLVKHGYRVNPAAALHPQAMVGARTDARLVNIPQSEAWARRIKRGGGAPEEVSPREVL